VGVGTVIDEAVEKVDDYVAEIVLADSEVENDVEISSENVLLLDEGISDEMCEKVTEYEFEDVSEEFEDVESILLEPTETQFEVEIIKPDEVRGSENTTKSIHFTAIFMALLLPYVLDRLLHCSWMMFVLLCCFMSLVIFVFLSHLILGRQRSISSNGRFVNLFNNLF